MSNALGAEPFFHSSFALEELEGDVHEDVRGPYLGHYLAAYCIDTPIGYFAYGKLCRTEPVSVWETPDALWKMSTGPCQDPDQALGMLEEAALARLDMLAHEHASRRRKMESLIQGPGGQLARSQP